MRGLFKWLLGTDPNYRRLILWSTGLSAIIAFLLVLERWG